MSSQNGPIRDGQFERRITSFEPKTGSEMEAGDTAQTMQLAPRAWSALQFNPVGIFLRPGFRERVVNFIAADGAGQSQAIRVQFSLATGTVGTKERLCRNRQAGTIITAIQHRVGT